MDELKQGVATAFGILWKDHHSSRYSNDARLVLGALLTREEKAAGINRAIARYGATRDAEILDLALRGDLP